MSIGRVPGQTGIQPSIVDAKGDIIAATAADSVSRLAVGANDTVLTADSSTATGLKWAAPAAPSFVGASIGKTAAQSIANTTFTNITWDTEDYDTSSFHDNSTNNTRITIPSGKGGYYLISGTVGFDLSSTGARIIRLYKNGSDTQQIVSLATAGGSDFTNLPFSFVISVVATDYLELYAYQASGGNLNVRTTSKYQVSYLGA